MVLGCFYKHDVVVVEGNSSDVEGVGFCAFKGVSDAGVLAHPVGKLDNGAFAAGEVDEFRALQTGQHIEVVGEVPVLAAFVGAAVGGEIWRVEDEYHVGYQMEEVDQAMSKINSAWQAASEDMHKAQQQADGNPGTGFDPNNMGGNYGNGSAGNPNAGLQGGQQSGDDNVTDVDYEEVK